jgi:hypothetical protein
VKLVLDSGTKAASLLVGSRGCAYMIVSYRNVSAAPSHPNKVKKTLFVPKNVELLILSFPGFESAFS